MLSKSSVLFIGHTKRVDRLLCLLPEWCNIFSCFLLSFLHLKWLREREVIVWYWTLLSCFMHLSFMFLDFHPEFPSGYHLFHYLGWLLREMAPHLGLHHHVQFCFSHVTRRLLGRVLVVVALFFGEDFRLCVWGAGGGGGRDRHNDRDGDAAMWWNSSSSRALWWSRDRNGLKLGDLWLQKWLKWNGYEANWKWQLKPIENDWKNYFVHFHPYLWGCLGGD
jgi:hypothetical protein